MYSLGIQREFAARPSLLGDGGPGNLPHAHQYRLEVGVRPQARHPRVPGLPRRYGDEIGKNPGRLRGQASNEQPAFFGLIPSLEHFALIIADDFLGQGGLPNIGAIRVKIWENEKAWAFYSREF